MTKSASTFLNKENGKVKKLTKSLEVMCVEEGDINYMALFFLSIALDLEHSLKSMRSLIKSKSYFVMEPLARSIFERYLYIKHVERNPIYAKMYFMSIEMRNISEYENLINKNFGMMSAINNDEGLRLMLINIFEDTSAYCGKKGKVDSFKDKYRKLFEKCDKSINFNTDQQLFNRSWYAYKKNINNLRDLAEDLSLVGDYMKSFGYFSGQVHGYMQNKTLMFSISNSAVEFKDISDYDEESLNMYSHYFRLCIDAIESIMKKYL